uniref:S1 motif domain-containing protein n=1 Tax=viral metagenome TaxID=1070528 RepID=A0A6C0BL56_9ZZZZ
MEYTAIFEERVPLTPRDLGKNIENIDDILLDKMSTRLENKCSRHGFVLPGTLKILSRSMGYVEKGRFTGDIVYHIQAEGKVLNPPTGIIIQGIVIRKNKMGMYVSFDDAIRVILPRDLHIGNEEFEAAEVGEVVKVEIQKSRFQVNDPYILSVGLFRGSIKGAPASAPASASASAFASAEAEAEVGEEEAEAGEEEEEEKQEEEEEVGEEEEEEEAEAVEAQ